jgi:hypothetical protein
MKRMKKLMVLPIIFLLIGCATNMKMNVVDPTGRSIPTPNYYLRSVSSNLSATFYYVHLNTKKDLDGTVVSEPTYLPMNRIYKASSNDSLLLVIEVSNPERIEYKLWSEIRVTYWKKSYSRNNMSYSGRLLAKSKVEYRQFVFKMPVSDKIKEVSYGVRLYEKSDQTLMYFGDFHYKLKRR